MYFLLHQVLKLFNALLEKQVKFTLQQAMKAKRGNRDIALLFL